MPRRLGAILLIILIILIPLFLINAWGMHFGGDVYLLLRYARAMGEGSGVVYGSMSEAAAGSSPSVLFSLLTGAFARFGADPALAAAVLSSLGWSATALAFLTIGKRLNRTAGSLIAALLLCFNPIVIILSGTSISWVIALAWWASAFLLHRRFLLMLAAILALVMMLLPLPVGVPVLQASLASAFAWTLFLFAIGIGAEIAAGWLAANVEPVVNSADKSAQVINLVLVVVFILAGGYQISKVNDLFQTKPQARWELENDVATWLEKNTTADALLGTSEKIGYLARRQTVPLESIVTPLTPQAAQDYLMEQPIQYLVSSDSLPWQLLANSRWFRLNYQALAEFENPYVADAPYTIWQYQPPPVDLGLAHALNARVPNHLRILGYQVDQENLEAANEVVLTLYLEAEANTIEPTTQFAVKTRLLSPLDASTLAEWDVVLPNSIKPENWQPGEQITEQITISAPPDLEPGAYPFNISLTGPESPEFWPISLDNDLKRLDRLQVGYLVVPAEVDQEALQVREAIFADKIKLLGYSASDPRPGEMLELKLFWQADELLQKSYVVFTHLLDSSGQLVANHDSIPGNGNYPTPSWIPGMTIADTHLIQLPPDLPAGDYYVRVGLYDPESGERLPVAAGDGSIPPDNALPLTQFSIP